MKKRLTTKSSEFNTLTYLLFRGQICAFS